MLMMVMACNTKTSTQTLYVERTIHGYEHMDRQTRECQSSPIGSDGVYLGECVLVRGRLKELDGHAMETMKRNG